MKYVIMLYPKLPPYFILLGPHILFTITILGARKAQSV